MLDVLGVGDGLAGVLELVLGSGLGLGEEVSGGEDELSPGVGVEVSVGDGVSVDDAAVVSVSVGDGVVVSVGDAVLVSVGDGVEVSAGMAMSEPVLWTIAAVSTAVVGGEAHIVLGGATGAVTACAARDCAEKGEAQDGESRNCAKCGSPENQRPHACDLTSVGLPGSRYLPYISLAHIIRAGAEDSCLQALDG